jgi:nucleotide sugar dehydrogenase
VKVAIIGMGVVGAAQARLFRDHELVTYDPKANSRYPAGKIARCDLAVICAGTPEGDGGHADLTGFRTALARLPVTLPVLIRSTVPPGTTAEIASARSGHTAFCPEFMHERDGGAWKESADVPWLILGGAPEATGWFRARLSAVHPGTVHECPAAVAELAKYTANLYWAARVTFVNEMAAACAVLGADWEQVRQAWLRDERVSPAYTAMEGFGPGFGGRCFPKDLAALIAASGDAGHKALFLEAVRDANGRFGGA